MPFYLILLAVALLAALGWLWLRRSPDPRQRTMNELLDAADGLEARLRTARAEVEEVTGDQDDDAIALAMREMLRQRIWLRDHGGQASVEQLAEVRDSIIDARKRIERQLSRVEDARQVESS